MTDFGAIASATIAYRFSVVAIGLVFAFLGYRLFRLGVYEKAGDLKATWKGASLLLRQAAPGTFFALFGTSIICVALFKGFDIQRVTGMPANATSTGLQPVNSTLSASQNDDFASVAAQELAPIEAKIQKRQALTVEDYAVIGVLYRIAVTKRGASVFDLEHIYGFKPPAADKSGSDPTKTGPAPIS
jgi:hypothetical protein